MGYDPALLGDNILGKIAEPAEKKRLGKAGLTSAETKAKECQRLERKEQGTLHNWLLLQEEQGKLVFNDSRTDRRTTNRKGLPDFQIWANNRPLLGEMKMEKGKLSPDQKKLVDRFSASGTPVYLWHSAEGAIEHIRNWLKQIPF